MLLVDVSFDWRATMTSPRRALIVIDAQQQYFDGLLAVEHPPRDRSVAKIGEALDVAARSDVPVVIVQHELPEGAPVFAAGSAGHSCTPRSNGAPEARRSGCPSRSPASSRTATWRRGCAPRASTP
jgi:nicotinamidase-related amidase